MLPRKTAAAGRRYLPAMAIMARDGKYAGATFITLPAGIRERLWRRVEEKAGPLRRRS